MTLLIGIAIGAILGFVFGMFVSGTITAPSPTNPSQMVGIPRIDALSTTLIGCVISIGVVLLYLYILEWSKGTKVPKEVASAKGVE